jgi:predicted RNA-binding Zn-ribbon protein involved in translation (DUF1610 family)
MVWQCRACEKKYKTTEFTPEGLKTRDEFSRLRCPTCKGTTRISQSQKRKHYQVRYRSCKCGWKQETYELTKEYFVALLKAAKEELPKPGGQPGNENASASGPAWTLTSSS